MELPEGTWMVSMKVNNEDVWENYVKTGRVKGFSIEGYFVDKLQMESHLEQIEEEEAEFLLSNIIAKIKKDGRLKSKKRIEMESYSDYPAAVRNNAKRGIELNEKGGNKCATQVGKIRAQQLADGKPVSVETISRMYSYLSRAETYYDEGDTEACGTISYLLWGGLAAKRWSESKLKELGKL
jgi:DNA-binding transcriptional regulator YhcF (GntR family)